MPCYDQYSDQKTEKIMRQSAEQNIEDRKKLDVLTDYLCMALTFIEGRDILKDAPVILQQWFTKHKLVDKNRINDLIANALGAQDYDTFMRLFKEK